jgi:hypothetical protein
MTRAKDVQSQSANSEASSPRRGPERDPSSGRVAELIRAVCAVGQRRAVRIVAPERRGHIFFDRAHIVHAEFGEDVGLRAVLEMLGAPSVEFLPCARPWPSQTSLFLSPEVVLNAAAKRASESEGLKIATEVRRKVQVVAARPRPEPASSSASTGAPGTVPPGTAASITRSSSTAPSSAAPSSRSVVPTEPASRPLAPRASGVSAVTPAALGSAPALPASSPAPVASLPPPTLAAPILAAGSLATPASTASAPFTPTKAASPARPVPPAQTSARIASRAALSRAHRVAPRVSAAAPSVAAVVSEAASPPSNTGAAETAPVPARATASQPPPSEPAAPQPSTANRAAAGSDPPSAPEHARPAPTRDSNIFWARREPLAPSSAKSTQLALAGSASRPARSLVEGAPVPPTTMIRVSARGVILAARGEQSERLADAAAFIYNQAKLIAADLGRHGRAAVHLRGGGLSLLVVKSEVNDVAAALGSTERLKSLLRKVGFG